MGIKRKFLGTMYLSIIVFGIIMFGLTYYQYKLTSSSIGSTLNQTEKFEMVSQLELALSKVVMPANDFLIHGDEKEREAFYALDLRVEELFSLLKSRYYLPGTETKEKELLFHVKDQYVRVKNISKDIFNLRGPIGNVEGARLMEEMDLLVDDILVDMNTFHGTIQTFLLGELESINSHFYRYMIIIIGTLIVVIIVSSLYGLLLAKRIINPINELVEGTKRLSDGDHTFRIETKTKNEIGDLTNSFNDMTSRLEESKKQLQDYALNLEKKVNEKTKEIYDKSSKIERVNKEMKDFIYVVSHDLKEPLFTIESYLSRLSKAYEGVFDEKGKRYVDRIKANIERMSRRIYDIVEVIKVGTFEYNFADNDCGDIVRGVIDELEGKIENNGIEVVIQDNLPTVYCDGRKMRDVLFNIVSNAIKYIGDSAQKTISIGCEKEQDYYKFVVEDTGIGISKEHHGRVFMIFNRLMDIEAEGTGIGLAIVKKIIERHKGKVWVESPVENGRGTRFCFTMPMT